MVFSADDRVLIKVLRQEKGYGAKKLIAEFPSKQWTLSGLKKLLRKIDTAGTVERKQGSGRKRTVRTNENVRRIEELVLSQEDQPGTHRTVRQISRETEIPRSTVFDVIHKDLKLKCFKKRRAQDLTEANKLSRLLSAKRLLKRYPEHAVQFIWFSDEKVFTVAPPVNLQNDRVYTTSAMKKKQLPAERLLRTRSTFSRSVMVSVAVSTLGRTDLFFVDPGTKVNGQYYRDVLLGQQLLPAIRHMSGDFFTFQQDNAPAHRARETVQLLTRETPDFIAPALWPANSPDLNPVDYQIWGKLQERVYRSRIQNVEQLKSRLIEEWEHFHQEFIDEAVKQWRLRLRACIRARGGHFEHKL